MKVNFWILMACSMLFMAGCKYFHFGEKTVAPVKTEILLGKTLFFDPILSADRKISCASCHKPEFAFADTTAFSKGINGLLTSRNTPSAMNVADRPYLFWDGRSPTLEDQVLHPIANPSEMGFNVGKVIKRLESSAFYVQSFQMIYNQKPTAELLGKAIAAFERSLETGDTPFDRFLRGDSTAVSQSAMRGRKLFIGKANCFDCHFSPDFTGDEFKNIGLFNGKEFNDSGRYKVSKNLADIGAFKVPGLRNVALTAPYMHNGTFASLRQVVEYYNNPSVFVQNAIGTDELIKPLQLTEQEKSDLVAFLESLTSVSLMRSIK